MGEEAMKCPRCENLLLKNRLGWWECLEGAPNFGCGLFTRGKGEEYFRKAEVRTL